MKIIVIGAGAWGTALAISASRHPAGHAVMLWARDAAQAQAMQASRENTRYLPGAALPPALDVASGPAAELAARVATADLVIIATPMAALRGLLVALAGCRAPVAWLCKGFEAPLVGAAAAAGLAASAGASGSAGLADAAASPGAAGAVGLLAHEVRAQVAPGLMAGVLSGPSFAQEVARGQPTALVAASPHAAVRDALVAAFHGPTLRVYANDDIVGVEVGGAVKNVLAIATGLCDGLPAPAGAGVGMPAPTASGLGLNARAALITRGLAEMTRLGVALGARADTFMGLSGLGDLVLTATGDLSRNRRVGLLLAQGRTLQQAVDSLGHVAEGVYCARTVVQRAQALGVDMPIAQGVVALLDGTLAPAAAVAALMGREPTAETS
jgi:glycerol-3-phosphate dehydrogenase (NAD(P)+)